jgi:type VI secretion system secreted protein Hcp
MAFDTYLKMADIKGESVAKGYEDQIEIDSITWGLSQSGTTHSATGSGAGKVNMGDISLTHKVDKSSPNLFLACAKGTHIAEATLTVCKAGGTKLPYVTITLTNLIVSSVTWGGTRSDDLLSETFTLNFGKVKYSYQPQDNKGAKAGGSIDATYDVAKGQDS